MVFAVYFKHKIGEFSPHHKAVKFNFAITVTYLSDSLCENDTFVEVAREHKYTRAENQQPAPSGVDIEGL